MSPASEQLSTSSVWQVLVPIKQLATAKTRLAVAPEARRELALSMALDTVAAIRAAHGVGTVWIVSRDASVADVMGPLGVTLLREAAPDPADRAPLNTALRQGLEAITSAVPNQPVAIVAADLPAMRSSDLAELLATSRGIRWGVVGDRAGSGTTILTGHRAAAINPQFGNDSLARHVDNGAVRLEGATRLRLDVDTLTDLSAALALGVGPHTVQSASTRQLA